MTAATVAPAAMVGTVDGLTAPTVAHRIMDSTTFLGAIGHKTTGLTRTPLTVARETMGTIAIASEAVTGTTKITETRETTVSPLPAETATGPATST